ncbi:MAG: phage terminase large subunit [Elusimicrobia bacterium]|nr:phage terminase large subunit [Elusimicrobiota bacterium]
MDKNQAEEENLTISDSDRRLWDLFVFAKRILSYDKITKLHMGWFKALLDSQFLLLLAPRGHLKSTVATTCYPLWRLTQDQNLRVLIVNETLDQARKFLGQIKDHILFNEIFRERYGAWDMAATKWTENSVVIPRTKILKEPSLACGGVLGNLVSLHNDLIILDDPVSNNNSLTPHMRDKLLGWFTNVILPALEPDGQLILVGTRWQAQDLYGHILESPGFSHWAKIVQSAEWRDEEGSRCLLFPERFTPEKLDQLKGAMGTASYYCQMLNDVSGQEGSDFKIEWLRAGRYVERPKDANIYIGVDLAAGSDESHSKFAYAVIAIPKGEKDAYVLDAQKMSIKFPEQVKTIKMLHRVHKPTIMGIEANAYQQSMLQVLRVDEETARLNIKGITTQGDKQRRIRGLAVLFENGAIRLPNDLTDLETELLHFPKGNDDLLDALWLALEAFHEQKTEPKIYFVDDLA